MASVLGHEGHLLALVTIEIKLIDKSGMEQGEALGLADRAEAALADRGEQAGDEPVRAQQGLLRTGGIGAARVEARIRVLARQGGHAPPRRAGSPVTR